MDVVICFEDVGKSYPLYHQFTGGLKNLIFHLGKGISSEKTVRYEALRGVTFSVERGEMLGIVGPNGAGKSTLLGLMAGVLKPNSGKVRVKGRVSPLLELGAGFHPELSGRDNALLKGVLMGFGRKEVRAKMDEIIDFSELGPFIDQPIRTYSSGMLARLGFSVVSHLDPDILLIDEILAVGDQEFQKKCFMKMETFRRNGVSMVFVSHSLPSVERLCARTMWLENHTVKMIGETGPVIRAYSG